MAKFEPNEFKWYNPGSLKEKETQKSSEPIPIRNSPTHSRNTSQTPQNTPITPDDKKRIFTTPVSNSYFANSYTGYSSF
jgi:hypothetical protein